MGQGAVNTGVQAGTNFGGQQASIITGQAAAQAAGQVGAANAYSGALGTAGNMMYLNSLMNRPMTVTAPVGGTPDSAYAPQAVQTSIA